jgi:hypothetical protein
VTADPPRGVPAPSARAGRPLRVVLTVAAGVLVLLCLGGLGVGVTLYDNATAINRGQPDEAVNNFLKSYLVEHNDVRASSLECAHDSGLEPIRAFRRDVQDREKAFGITILISWGPLQVAPSGDRRIVSTQLIRRIQGAERSTQNWQFTVVDENGWRVCGAARVD